MSEMATRFEMSPATLRPFGQVTASLSALTDCYSRGLPSTSGYPSPTPREWGNISDAALFHDQDHDVRANHLVPARLLLIDDDPVRMLALMREVFPASAYRIQVIGTDDKGLEQIRTDPPDVILLDLSLSHQSGLESYRQIRLIDTSIPVIFVTRTRTADAAIEAMRQGAYDHLIKPLDPHHVRRVVGEALDVVRRMRQSTVVVQEVPDQDAEGAIVGTCPGMRELYKAIGRVAAQDVPVLITGESGTGKELVARALYQHGRRAKAPYLALNCAAIPENLLESELFGHEKGAFTGADRRHLGKFEQCHGGTLLLDEIGDMPLTLQAKILRVLQEQEFQRVGGSERIRTDVRLIAATNRDLRALTAEGKFRADLYYRLGVFTIHLPPLRERQDDLPLLVRHYLRRFSRELGRDVQDIAPEALKRLSRYAWPGNIRELQSILKQALLHARGRTLLSAFLPDLPEEPVALRTAPALVGGDAELETFIRRSLDVGAGDLLAAIHRKVDLLLLTRVLEETNGNQHQAARLLGIARETLRRRIRELGLCVSRQMKVREISH